MAKQISGQTALSGFQVDNRPPVGTLMYMVRGHAYYVREKPYPLLEYLVCQARVKSHCQYGSEPEIELLVCVPNEPHDSCYTWSVPEIVRASHIGKFVYYTPKEAAEAARRLTDEYDRTWGWCDAPLRRTWERLLDGAEFYFAPLISRRCPDGAGTDHALERGG